MSKCGKGCMPECEYFVTCGCTSPFNCPYKIETGYINSATSTPDGLTGLLIEFDEMGFAPTTPCPNSEEYAIGWRGKVRKEIERLKAENSAFRARLDKSVELKEPYYVVDNDSGMIRLYYEKVVRYGELYEDLEEAESRLSELKGEQQ